MYNIDKLLDNKNLSRYREFLNNFQNKSHFKDHHFDSLTTNLEEKKLNSIWNKFNTSDGQKDLLILSNFIEENYLYWHRWVKSLKDSEIPIKIFWRKDDIGLKEITITLAANQPKNVEFIQNIKCYTIDENPIDWLLLMVKEINQKVYTIIKNKRYAV